MKVFLIGLLLSGAYALSLTKMTDMVVNEVVGINTQYQSVTATADQWATGDTSNSFADN